MFLLFYDNVASECELMKIATERLDYLWFLGLRTRCCRAASQRALEGTAAAVVAGPDPRLPDRRDPEHSDPTQTASSIGANQCAGATQRTEW